MFRVVHSPRWMSVPSSHLNIDQQVEPFESNVMNPSYSVRSKRFGVWEYPLKPAPTACALEPMWRISFEALTEFRCSGFESSEDGWTKIHFLFVGTPRAGSVSIPPQEQRHLLVFSRW